MKRPKAVFSAILSDPVTALGFVWLTAISLTALVMPLLPLQLSYETDSSVALTAPSSEHWFGTDALGRDLFSRILRGTQISLACGIAGALTALILGVGYGLVSGGGSERRDHWLMRFVDLIDSIPLVFLVILIASALRGTALEASGGGLGVFFVILGVVYWTPMARVVRGETRVLARREWALAATALGVPPQRVLYREILPNLVPTIIVTITLIVPRVLLFEAFLSFLGLGVQSPAVSWGTLARDAFEVLNPVKTAWWLILYPSLALAFTLLALNVVGDQLRRELDPKQR
ncbi:MAG: hypothetical protein CBC13_07300 [Planctomycetia bacterium TMED53]|nr:MAG: hypothetical protein CBC13_07300 [Planctomycetia bacterium TMED53]